MTEQEAALWKRIREFDIDGGPVALPFTLRLARENGWTRAHAERVVEEYRRFVFLAMVAGHPVTPSEDVDQAWHLHLLYVESYWHRFVGEVLPRPLVHGPTKGGQAEGAKFHDWYTRTLASYQAWFGTSAPTHIWPPSRERFAQRHVRVNLNDAYVIPKSRVRRLAQLGATVTAAVGVGGCLANASASSQIELWLLGGFVLFIGLVVGLALVLGHRTGRRGSSGCATSACGAFSSSSGDRGGDADGGGGDGGSGCGSGCGGGCGGGGD